MKTLTNLLSLITPAPRKNHHTDEMIRFYRRGYFKTFNPTEVQCTLTGWEAYRYKVTMEAGNRLDENGFLIDHNLVHAAICKWVKENPMFSCEETLQKLCYSIGDQLIESDVDLRKLGLEIAPVDANLLEPDETGELVPTTKMKLEQIMPAGAEYWCTFQPAQKNNGKRKLIARI